MTKIYPDEIIEGKEDIIYQENDGCYYHEKKGFGTKWITIDKFKKLKKKIEGEDKRKLKEADQA